MRHLNSTNFSLTNDPPTCNGGWSSLLQTLIHLVSSLTARNITRLFWSLYLDLAKINGDLCFASDIEPENFKRTGKMLVVHNVGVREVPVVGHKVRPPAVNSNVNDIPLSICIVKGVHRKSNHNLFVKIVCFYPIQDSKKPFLTERRFLLSTF